jgi:hypothetical protein
MNDFYIYFFGNFNFFLSKVNFFIFLYCVDIVILKIIKKYYFNIFLNKK